MTELITIDDTPFRNSLNFRDPAPDQQLTVERFCGSANLDDRVCVHLFIRPAGSHGGQSICLTRAQATVLCDVLTQEVLNY